MIIITIIILIIRASVLAEANVTSARGLTFLTTSVLPWSECYQFSFVLSNQQCNDNIHKEINHVDIL